VIDNASSDGSAELVRQDFPWVRLIASKQNHGYGAAANVAITSCSSKYVLLLNCDTLLQPGTLQALSDYLDQHPRVAVVGPSLVNPDGTRQISCFAFPTPLQTLLRETSLPFLLQRLSPVHFNNLLTGPPQYTQAVPWVLGAALAIRCSALESVGGFDPSFFMYYEEVDLCYRLQKAGWEIHFAPVASITHVGGASTKQHRTAMASQLYRSLCHFYQQHYSGRQILQLKLIMTYLMIRNIIRDSFRSSHIAALSRNRYGTDDLLVWRSVLFNLWSTGGWFKKNSQSIF
jgi:GT2 family glycosyltransferase